MDLLRFSPAPSTLNATSESASKNNSNVSESATMTNEGSDGPYRPNPSVGREGASLQAVLALLKDSDDEDDDDADLFR